MALRKDVTSIGLPIKKIVDESTNQPKIKKLLANIVYVGVLAELLNLDQETLNGCLRDQFGGKESVIEVNNKAMEMGRQYAQANLKASEFPFKAGMKPGANSKRMMIEGNTAAALGMLAGGATFAA